MDIEVENYDGNAVNRDHTISSNDNDNNVENLKPKKRPRNESLWKRNKLKKARLEGTKALCEEDGSVLVQERILRPKCGCKQDKCVEKFTQEECEAIINRFNRMPSHDVQNMYLRGLTRIIGVQKRSGWKVYQHAIGVGNNPSKVCCQAFFTSVHGISRARLRKKVLDQSCDIKDKRGGPRTNRMTNDEVLKKIRDFLSSLDARCSHYSLENNQNKKYIESHSSVSQLYRDFIDKNAQFSERIVSSDVFRKVFMCEFNIGFGYPRSDICAKCELLQTQISVLKQKMPVDEGQLKQKEDEKELHLLDAKDFYTAYEEATELSDETIAFCFDFKKGESLPVTKIGPEYFKSQLTVNTFGVHNLQSGKGTMFIYSEHFGPKSPNEIASCLQWLVNSNQVQECHKHLKLFCDGPYGQNRNRYMFAFCQYLADTKFDTVSMTFPETGHSRMPIDRDFASIEIARKRSHRLHSPSDYVNIINQSRPHKPFDIVYVNYPFTDNLENDGHPIAHVKDFKGALEPILKKPDRTSEIRSIIFKPDSLPVAKCKRSSNKPDFELILFTDIGQGLFHDCMYRAPLVQNDFSPISIEKLINVEFLVPHVTNDPCPFFKSLYSTVKKIRVPYGKGKEHKPKKKSKKQNNDEEDI